ncbi:hypothetical protein [Tahibacter sp.]|uniref:hypothetical protein n=1 Tax=Tahibacter sp. TaxID=2056211 RepID=UPI0028C3D991|nr:hypothetical protein [Tahibacter sp.]
MDEPALESIKERLSIPPRPQADALQRIGSVRPFSACECFGRVEFDTPVTVECTYLDASDKGTAMAIAARIKANYLARMDDLIAAGTGLPMKQHSQRTSINMHGETTYRQYNLASRPEFIEWRTSCVAILDQVVPPTSLLRKTLNGLHGLKSDPSQVEYLIGFLRSVRKELEAGSLDSLALQIEAEVISDYLEQASAALAGNRDEPNYIAAAVIAGASLERCLRTVCGALSPPEPTSTDKGAPLGMSSLIDTLKKRGAFNELQAKELRAWAALRNAAAHGNFAEFNRQQVETMVSGVVRFVTENSR